MSTAMVVVGSILVVLPIVLMLVFNGFELNDSRGRRVVARWRARKP